jgi:hypothetical protein
MPNNMGENEWHSDIIHLFLLGMRGEGGGRAIFRVVSWCVVSCGGNILRVR